MNTNFVIGDIHGHFDTLVTLLRDDVGLIDHRNHWCGRDATLCFIGDYFDRGPNGLGAIDLIIQLQAEAMLAGGRVVPLLGNHDVLILAAYKFKNYAPRSRPGENVLQTWALSGGIASDLKRMTSAHILWLSRLSALARVDDALLMHADSTFYVDYGWSITEVNTTIRNILNGDDPAVIDELMENFTRRYDFSPLTRQGRKNRYAASNLELMLTAFGGKRIIHGHTPVFRMSQEEPEDVTAPYIYADGQCINVDHGLYKGGQGFVYTF